jgi:hypothetical protein
MEYNEIDPTAEITIEFGPDSPNWQKTHEHNIMFFSMIANKMQNRLNACGHLFVNEVISFLDDGLILPQGQLVGWMPGEDNYVDMSWSVEKDFYLITLKPQGFIWNQI